MSASELKKKEAELQQKEADLENFRVQLENFKATLEARKEKAKKNDAVQALANLESSRAAKSQTIVKGVIGNVCEFSLDEDWDLWYSRLQMYFVANDVEQDKMPPVFLTLLGKDGYALLQNLLSPLKPHEVTLNTMVTTLKSHLQPAPSVIAERYKFKECRQSEGQDVKGFLAKLKKASTHCDFGTSLDSALRDQFVWGLTSEHIKKKLLSEVKLTYNRAVELAFSLEAADQNAAEMKFNQKEAVHFIKSHRRKSPFVSGKGEQCRHQQQRHKVNGTTKST